MEMIKAREKPALLTILELLDKRMTLSSAEKQHLYAMSKGYDGEVLFDSMIEKYIDTDVLILNDLSLISGTTPFQIDSVVLTSDTLYLYEVKNFEGKYTNRSGQFHSGSGQELINPVNQLSRTATLLSKMLKKWKLTIPVQTAVVFVNPTFVLYEAEEHHPFIFPSQIATHFTAVNQQKGPLSTKHHSIAQKLMEETQKELPYRRQLPYYDFNELKKGLPCSRCGSFDLKHTTKKSRCQVCDTVTSVNELVLAQVKAFKILFPDRLVTSNNIYDWCNSMLPKRRITAILNTAYKRKGHSKATHYC